MLVSWDDKKLRRFKRDLERFASQALPFANRDSLNDGVFMARKVAQQQLGERMILRNRFTADSVGVQKAKQKLIRDQFALVGGLVRAPYLETQEFGGTRGPKGKHGVPIPTRSASNEGRGTQPRRRVVAPPKTLQRIRLRRVRGVTNRRRRNAIAISQAAGGGRRFVSLETRRGAGLFRVMGGHTKPRVELMWDLSKRTVRTPANPWLKPSVDIVRARMPGIYRKNLKKQLLRRRLFAR